MLLKFSKKKTKAKLHKIIVNLTYTAQKVATFPNNVHTIFSWLSKLFQILT